jgi:hypothetical protein
MTGTKKARKSVRPRAERGRVAGSRTHASLSTTTLPLGSRTAPASEAGANRERNAIEVQVHQVDTAPALAAHAHRVLEVWTRGRVYTLDAQFVCVEVIELKTGQPSPRHPLLGSRLVGGQVRKARAEELTLPFPTPGSEAVFQGLDGKGRPRLQVTSRVKRVILHVRRVRVSLAERENAWQKLAGAPGED